MYTSLTPSLFIEVPELSQEESFICVLGISNIPVSTIFFLNAGTVSTVLYFFFHFIIGCEQKSMIMMLWLTSPNSCVEIAIIKIRWF
jgi:hypothetical protein